MKLTNIQIVAGLIGALLGFWFALGVKADEAGEPVLTPNELVSQICNSAQGDHTVIGRSSQFVFIFECHPQEPGGRVDDIFKLTDVHAYKFLYFLCTQTDGAATLFHSTHVVSITCLRSVDRDVTPL